MHQEAHVREEVELAGWDTSLLESKLGVRFRNPLLMQEALTHSSFSNENPQVPVGPNERLEFLGDAILDYLTANYLFRQFPEMQEGEMTALRAALVKTASLASFARAWDLGRHLRLGRGEKASGGKNRLANLCAAFEAVVGALYLDQGMEAVRQVVEPLISRGVGELLATSTPSQPDPEFLIKDAKSRLQELAQSLYHLTPSYRTIAEHGPDHEKEFTVEVMIGTVPRGRGVGRSKQAAEQDAAREALAALLLQQDDAEGAGFS